MAWQHLLVRPGVPSLHLAGSTRGFVSVPLLARILSCRGARPDHRAPHRRNFLTVLYSRASPQVVGVDIILSIRENKEKGGVYYDHARLNHRSTNLGAPGWTSAIQFPSELARRRTTNDAQVYGQGSFPTGLSAFSSASGSCPCPATGRPATGSSCQATSSCGCPSATSSTSSGRSSRPQGPRLGDGDRS